MWARSDHHVAKKQSLPIYQRSHKTGHLKEAHSKEEIGCNNPNCSLTSAIVIPLMINQEVAGTLKFYFTNEYENTTSTKQLARGLADIFSSQLELGQAEMQSKLLKDVKSNRYRHRLIRTSSLMRLIPFQPSYVLIVKRQESYYCS